MPITEKPQAAEEVPNWELLQALKTYTVHEVSKTEDKFHFCFAQCLFELYLPLILLFS